MRYLNTFLSSQTLFRFRSFVQTILILSLGIIGLSLLWLSLPGPVQADSPGTVKNNVKIAHNLNGGPVLTDDDRFGVSLSGIGDLNGDGIEDLAVGAYRDDTGGTDRGAIRVLFMQGDGTVSGTVKIASGLNGGPVVSDFDLFGVSVGVVGDLNRDGVQDLAVGASGDDTGTENGGAVHILFMRSNGTVSSSIKIASSLNGGPALSFFDLFGGSISGLGDLDRDGIEDIAVGASLDDTGGTDRGAFYILFMKADGTVKNSLKIASGLNGGPTLANSDIFGGSISMIGDLDRDGVQDLAVGTYHDNTGGIDRGAIYVLFMRTNGTVKNSIKIASGLNGGPALTDRSNFGVSVSTVDDLDRDGVIDLAVGASAEDIGPTGQGAVHILFMRTDGTVKSSVKIASGLNGGPALAAGIAFGGSVTRLGDLNQDGIDDLAVGAWLDDTGGVDRGSFYILSIDGIVNSPNGAIERTKIAHLTNGGPSLANTDLFGASVNRIGDLNRDGVEDLAIGAYLDNTGGTDRGAVYVAFMKANGTVSNTVKIASGLNGGPSLSNSDAFGIGISGIGDLNRDGVEDLAVSAVLDRTGGFEGGAVYILFMRTNGTVSSSVKIAHLTNGGPVLNIGDQFGHNVNRIGDLNRDGIEDLAVGTFQDDTGGTDRGAVYILFMKADGTVSSNVKIAHQTNGGPALANSDKFGTSVAGLGDLDRDGVEDLAVGAYFDNTGGPHRGAVYVLFMNLNGTVRSSVKIASGLNGGPTLADGDIFGLSVDRIGDLNRDSVEDMVVGAYEDNTGGPTRGAAYVLMMNANGSVASHFKLAHLTRGGPALADGDHFGWVTGIGDLNRDGIEDLAVGAVRDDTGGTDRGAVYILPLGFLPDPSLTKTVNPTTVNPGGTLTYTLTFSNSGSQVATGVVITDILPVGVTAQSVINSGAAITRTPGVTYAWTIQNLAPGQGGVITIAAQANPALTAGLTFTNTATISSASTEINLFNNSAAAKATVTSAPNECSPGGVWPAYGPAVNLIEELANGSQVELTPAYPPTGYFQLYSMLKEGDIYYLWLNSLQYNGPNYQSKEQRLESQDGLVWHRTDTNLVVNSSSYRYIAGIRQVIKSGALYEGWELYSPEIADGSWAVGLRYITSPDGLNWTVINQPALATANYPSVIKEGNTYHMWAMPDADPDKILRYRSSTSGGTGWGHWKTGGTKVILDGAEFDAYYPAPRVRRLADGTYQMSYFAGHKLNLATSTDRVHFTTQITGLIDFDQMVPGLLSVGDVTVMEVGGEDWVYFAYRTTDEVRHIAVTRPVKNCNLALSKTVTPTTVQPGDLLTYTLTLSNTGENVATGVVLTDIVPNLLTNLNVSSNLSITSTGVQPGYVWQVQDLSPGATGLITITGKVSASLTSELTFTNTATVASTSGDNNPLDNSATASATLVPVPDECNPSQPGGFPVYGPAVNLVEQLANGSQVALAPAYSPGNFSLYSFLKEGDTYYLWFNNLQYSGANYQSKEQRLESQDGLVWHNRRDTNLVVNSSSYQRILGIRQVIKNGPLYEGWEVHAPETVNGWWSAGVRYLTSPDGLNWTVVNQSIMATANVPSVIKEGNIYHLWAIPDVDDPSDPDKILRYRSSTSGGTGWGHWKTGGAKVILDGTEFYGYYAAPRVRRMADGTYQLSYLTGNKLNLATSTDKINFTTVVTGLIDFDEKIPGLVGIGDVAVVEVGGEDWVYFTYMTTGEVRHMAVTRPVKGCNINLALSKTVTPTVALPGQPITYTLTFTNEGPGIAQGVVITDLVPVDQVSNLAYSAKGVVITPTGSSSYTWQVSDLAAGQRGTIILTGIVTPTLSPAKIIEPPPGNPNLIVNTASIAGTGIEGDPVDNQDTVTTTVTLPKVQFKALSYSVVENKGLATIMVTIAPPPFLTVTVRLTSADGTASHLSDYKPIDQRLTFAPGVASLTTTMVVSDDTLVEGAENLTLRLSQPAWADLGLYTTATLTLLDNDRASNPAHQVYLPLLLSKASGFPIFIGNPIPAHQADPVGQTFYSRWVDIPGTLPTGGRFYFSSRPDQVTEIFVDDRLVVSLSNGGEIFSYQSFKGQTNFVEVSRAVLEQMAGKSVLVEYKDRFGSVIRATEVWLIWVP